jgi:hypothetical protein
MAECSGGKETPPLAVHVTVPTRVTHPIKVQMHGERNCCPVRAASGHDASKRWYRLSRAAWARRSGSDRRYQRSHPADIDHSLEVIGQYEEVISVRTLSRVRITDSVSRLGLFCLCRGVYRVGQTSLRMASARHERRDSACPSGRAGITANVELTPLPTSIRTAAFGATPPLSPVSAEHRLPND